MPIPTAGSAMWQALGADAPTGEKAFVCAADNTSVLGRIADQKITRLDELMPWSYAAVAA